MDSLEAVFFAVLFTVLLVAQVFLGFALLRNNRTYAARMLLISFFADSGGDTEDKHRWFTALPAYEKMCNPFPNPFRPMADFVTGKYAEEFWAWAEKRNYSAKLWGRPAAKRTEVST